MSSEETLERNHVFWALYVVDKQVSTAVGIPCCLPSFDCDVSLPKGDSSDPFLEYWIARIELATIQEDTYQSLYSSQACRRGDSERQSQITRLDCKLASWASNNKDLCIQELDDEGLCSEEDSSTKTALSYLYYSIRILVHRPGKEASDKQQCRDKARYCIQLFARLNHDSASIDSAIMLRQIIRNHPLVPFFLLFAGIIQSPASDESAQDLQLMLRGSDVLQQIQRSGSRSYMPQLLSVTSSCCEAASAIIRKATWRPPSTPILGAYPTTSASGGPTIHNSDPWAAARSMWTGACPGSPILASLPEQLEVPENWNFDFSNLLDPATGFDMNEHEIATMLPPMPSAVVVNLASGVVPMETGGQEPFSGYNTAPWQKDWTKAAGRNGGWPNGDLGPGFAPCNQVKASRWSETWLR